MEIESTNSGGRAWRDNRWLVLVEFAVVVAIYVARQHHILKVSATPYLLLLAWISLRLRKVQWKQIGFARYRTWATTLLLGVACGVGLAVVYSEFEKKRVKPLIGQEFRFYHGPSSARGWSIRGEIPEAHEAASARGS